MIYLICFGVSLFFAYLAKRSHNKANFIFYSILSIMVTVLLAGMRDVSIGIDTVNYYYGSWARAMSSGTLSQMLETYFIRSRGRSELLFAVLTWIIAKGTGNFHILLLITHLIIIGGVYIGAFRMKTHADPVFTLALFYFLYYNHSLNISRQYIAMAILFAAAADIEEGKKKRYFLFIVIAFLFHNTGILGLIPLLLYTVLYPGRRLENVTLSRRVVLGVFVVGAFYGFIPLAQFLIRRGVLGWHYSSYFLDEEAAIPKIVIVLLVLEVVGLILWGKRVRGHDSHADFFLFCSVAFIVIYQLATMILYGKRIAAYLSFLNIITLGMLPESQKSIYKNEHVIRAVIILAVVVYWLFFYAYRNSSRTMPYVFGI